MAGSDNKIVGFVTGIVQFFSQVRTEMKKVTWASWNELKESTILVILSIIVLTVIVGVFDVVLSKFIDIVVK